MMTYIKLTLSLYVLVIALWGCTNADQQLLEEGSAVTARLTVNLPTTKATADMPTNESVVHRARVIVVASEGTTREGKVTGNQFFDHLQGLKLEALALSGISDIYVLANETPEQTQALNKIASLQQLKNALVGFKPLPAGTSAYGDLPMMAMIPNVIIDLDSKKNIFKATLKRLWAKFNICFKAEGTYIDQVQLISIELQSLPKYSYWLDGHAYPETNFTKGTKTELNGDEGLLISATPTQSFVFYAPEYLVTDPDAHTRLIVRGYKKEVPSILCVYRVALGHNPSPETEDEAVDYNIHRNTRYNMTGVIKGYGGGDVDVEMTVNKWDDTVEMGEATGKYFTPSTNEADIAWNTTSFTIGVVSNVVWKAELISGIATITQTVGLVQVNFPANILDDYNNIKIKVYTEEKISKKKEFYFTVKQLEIPGPHLGALQIAKSDIIHNGSNAYHWNIAMGLPESANYESVSRDMGIVRTGCNTIAGVGGGWRVPNITELMQISSNQEKLINKGMVALALGGYYWSSVIFNEIIIMGYEPSFNRQYPLLKYGNYEDYGGVTVRCVKDLK